MPDTEVLDSNAAQQLNKFVESLEELEEDKKNIAERIKDTYAVAKSEGYDPKILRMIMKLRARPSDEVDEEEQLLEVYKKALGMSV